VGEVLNLVPMPLVNDYIYNIRRLLLEYCYNFFVIGAGYAATDSMPANGHVCIIDNFHTKTNISATLKEIGCAKSLLLYLYDIACYKH